MIQFFPPVKLDKAVKKIIKIMTISNLSLTLEQAVAVVSLNLFKCQKFVELQV